MTAGGQTGGKERFFQVSGIITDGDNNVLSNVGVISLKLKERLSQRKDGHIFNYQHTETPCCSRPRDSRLNS